MSATVIELDSRRPGPKPCCQKCRVRALLGRVAEQVDDVAGELLIPAAVLLDLAEDVRATITAVLEEEQPTERTQPSWAS